MKTLFARATAALGAVLVVVSTAHAAFGDRDCSFGTNGTLTISGASGRPYAAADEPGGTTLLRTGIFGDRTGTLYRSNASGTAVSAVATTVNAALADAFDTVLPDGRILFTTGVGDSTTSPAVGRLLANGTLDTTFGNNGYAVINGLAIYTGPLLQPDGRILVAGYVMNGSTTASAIARLNADGSVDTSFGSGGLAINTMVGSSGYYYQSLALQPNGYILAGGENLIARHRPDGQIDTSFGGTGQVSWGRGGVLVRVQPSGKILGVGNGGFGTLRIKRYTTTGALDITRDVTATGGTLAAGATTPIAVMSDGRPILVGPYWGTNGNSTTSGALVRLTVDLADETSVPLDFAPNMVHLLPSGRAWVGNSSGAQVRGFLGDADAATCVSTTTSVTATPNPSRSGQSVTLTATVTPASGTASPTGTVQFRNGGTNLGAPVTLAGGTATMSTSALPEGANSLDAVYSPTGSFVGSVSTAFIQTVQTARASATTTVSTSPNPSAFGQTITLTAVVSSGTAGVPTGTVQFLSDGYPLAPAVALNNGVATLTTFALRAGPHSITASYSGDNAYAAGTPSPITHTVGAAPAPGVFGDRDCSFGQGGVATFGTYSTLNAVADSDGTLVVRMGQDIQNSLQRVGMAGNLLNGLGPLTQNNPRDRPEVILPDGSIAYAIGSISTSAQPFGGPPGAGRMHADGSADATFGSGGRVVLAAFNSNYNGLNAGPIVQPDGRMLFAGTNGSAAVLTRLNSDGSVDTSFGTNGVVTNGGESAFNSLALQSDGRIIALGSTTLARYLPTGQVDTSFGTNGTTLIGTFLLGGVVRLQRTGHIIVEGGIPGSNPVALRVARLTPSGALDTSIAGGLGYRNVMVGSTAVVSALGPSYNRPLTLMPDGRVLVVTALASSGSSSATTGVLMRYGADLSDDATALLDFPATFVTVLPDGKFIVGRYGFAAAELRRLLDVGDPTSCIVTTTTMTSSPNPSEFAQPVTLTATVAASSGTTTPAGTVQFRNGTTLIGSPATLSGGVATLTTSSLPSGTLSLTATYNGQGSFAASASAPVTQVVHTALTVNDQTVNVAAATSMTFTVTLSSPMGSTVTVDYATADHTAFAGVDYNAQTGTLTFAPGETTKTVVIALAPRIAPQPDKDFFLLLSNPTNTVLARSNGIGKITYASTGALTLFVDDPFVLEGYSGITLMGFTVTLSAAQSSKIVTVNYATANGTGTAGVDFTGVSGTITFGFGETKHFVMVPVLANATPQPDRTVLLNLSGASGATIIKSQGTGTIKDDDPAPPAATITQYRLYSPVTNEHLYTTDTNEYSVLGTRGWVQEGVAYTMFKVGGSHGSQYPVPLYRMYHGGIQQHHWTTDTNEVMVLVHGGAWSYEGIAGYVLPKADTGTTPLYRLSYAKPPLHLWTTDLNEKDTLAAQFGWRYEGVVGEVLP